MTAQTRGLLGERELGALPRAAFVVNLGRGATIDTLGELFVDNLGRYVRGEPLLNVVDKQAGY